MAIARANRVCDGKSNGLIVDYIGIVKALRKALTDYTQGAVGCIKIVIADADLRVESLGLWTNLNLRV